MKLSVVGSRDFPLLPLVTSYLDHTLWEFEDGPGELECVVSGGARGVDRKAEAWGLRHKITVVSFRPVETRTGWKVTRWTNSEEGFSSRVLPQEYPTFAAAAFVRNGFIVEFGDETVAFHHGGSHGTRDSISKAREAGKLRDVIHA